MTATQLRRKPSRPARPVAEVLLELAYHLHTTRPVARLPRDRTEAPRDRHEPAPPTGRGR